MHSLTSLCRSNLDPRIPYSFLTFAAFCGLHCTMQADSFAMLCQMLATQQEKLAGIGTPADKACAWLMQHARTCRPKRKTQPLLRASWSDSCPLRTRRAAFGRNIMEYSKNPGGRVRKGLGAAWAESFVKGYGNTLKKLGQLGESGAS